jgi:hypothetical protein
VRPRSNACLLASLLSLCGPLLLPTAGSAQVGVTGVLTGTVRAADTGLPLAGIGVTAFDSAGARVKSAISEGTGFYYTTLSPGSYYIVASRDMSGYEDQLYPNIPCRLASCNVKSGTPVLITGYETTTLDFSLRILGGITGTVTSVSGAPLAMVVVRATGASGYAAGYTNASGQFTLSGLYTGSYYLITSNTLGYYDQIYNGITCPSTGCPPATTGTAVQVTAGSTTSGITFSLTPKGYIAGMVRAAGTGTPLAGVAVIAQDASGIGASATTDAAGAYTVLGLTPGSYYLRTVNSLGYLDELYADLPCVHGVCTMTSGTAVAVTLSAPGTANFDLALGGTISGTVRAAIGGAPVSGVYVHASNASGDGVRMSAATDATGQYTLIGLSGSYYLNTIGPGTGFFDQIYSGITCTAGCPSPTIGAAVSVAAGATTPNIDFSLQAGGTMAGSVSDAATDLPVTNVNVYLYNSRGIPVSLGVTDTAGTYTVSGVAPGTYFVRTSNATGYLDQLYAGIPCISGNCTVTNGTPVVMTFGSSAHVNFALARGGSISGTVRAASGGSGLQNIALRAFTSSGVEATVDSYTDASGQYTIRGLPTGTYYVRTTNGFPFIQQIYNGVNCQEDCPAVTTGTPVAVTAGSSVAGIDFSLLSRGTVSGTIRAATTGLPISGVIVTVYNSAGRSSGVSVSNSYGMYTVSSLLPASYFIKTGNSLGYRDQLYSGISCAGGCTVTSGTAVSVTSGSALAGIDFALALARPTFTDDPLVAGVTPVKAVHIVELRQAIATLCASQGLPPVAWTDATLVPGVTPVKGVHLVELRAALASAYQAGGHSVPVWTPISIAGGETVVTASGLQELRDAIAAIW